MRIDLISKNPLLSHSISFSLLVIEYCGALNRHQYFILSKQLLRSATSIGANVMEAQNAESRADFRHKLKIAAKESDETQYWLILCQLGTNCEVPAPINDKLSEIQKLLTSILSKMS